MVEDSLKKGYLLGSKHQGIILAGSVSYEG